jgi:hypothetical protein
MNLAMAATVELARQMIEAARKENAHVVPRRAMSIAPALRGAESPTPRRVAVE